MLKHLSLLVGCSPAHQLRIHLSTTGPDSKTPIWRVLRVFRSVFPQPRVYLLEKPSLCLDAPAMLRKKMVYPLLKTLCLVRLHNYTYKCRYYLTLYTIRYWNSRPVGCCSTHYSDLGKRSLQALDPLLSPPTASIACCPHLGTVCSELTAYAYS